MIDFRVKIAAIFGGLMTLASLGMASLPFTLGMALGWGIAIMIIVVALAVVQWRMSRRL